MHQYVVLLRGFNTGQIRMKKDQLDLLLTRLNFSRYEIIGTTGNILIETKESIKETKEKIIDVLNHYFQQVIPIFILTFSDFVKNENVFEKTENELQHYILFCNYDLRQILLDDFNKKKFPLEQLQLINNGLYWMTPKGHTLKGFGKTALNTKYKYELTSRNRNTINKIVECIKTW